MEYVLTPVGIEVSTNVEVMGNPPEADILLLRRHGRHWSEAQKARLPDGIRDSDAGHILIEFKYTESLSENALRQAVGYDYFYQNSRKLQRHQLQSVVVSAKTPRRATLTELGYELDGHPGVYRSRYALVKHILLLVSNDLNDTPHNAPIQCFASRAAIKQHALKQLQEETRMSASTKLRWFLDGLLYWLLKKGGSAMAEKFTVTPEDITNLGKQLIDQLLSTMSMEDRLRSVPMEDRLRGVPMEDRLRGVPHQDMLKQLSPEEIEHYLQQQKQHAGNDASSQESPAQEKTH